MSKLFERAKVKRENAELDYEKLSIKDAYKDDCCYNLQQTIELTLKYIVELFDGNYAESYDIRTQLNKLKSLGIDLPCKRNLRLKASIINSWHNAPCYNDKFVASIEDIDDVRNLADELIVYADSLVILK